MPPSPTSRRRPTSRPPRGCRRAPCRVPGSFGGICGPWRGLYRPRWRPYPASGLVVAAAAGVAHGAGDAFVVVDDDHPVAHLHVAVVALGDDDLLAVVLVDRDRDAAGGAVAVDRSARDRAADRAEHAAQHRAAGRAADRGARDRAADATDTAADQGAVADATPSIPEIDVLDRDHPSGFAAKASLGRGLDARLNAAVLAGAESHRQRQRRDQREKPLAEHLAPPAHTQNRRKLSRLLQRAVAR